MDIQYKNITYYVNLEDRTTFPGSDECFLIVRKNKRPVRNLDTIKAVNKLARLEILAILKTVAGSADSPRYMDPLVIAETYRSILSELYKKGDRSSIAYKMTQQYLNNMLEEF